MSPLVLPAEEDSTSLLHRPHQRGVDGALPVWPVAGLVGLELVVELVRLQLPEEHLLLLSQSLGAIRKGQPPPQKKNLIHVVSVKVSYVVDTAFKIFLHLTFDEHKICVRQKLSAKIIEMQCHWNTKKKKTSGRGGKSCLQNCNAAYISVP